MIAIKRLFLVFLVGNAAFGAGAQEIRIFAVNLWSAAVDLKWGDSGPFQTRNLAPTAVTRLVVLDDAAPRPIFFKPATAAAWMETQNESGGPLRFAVRPGKTYMILVKPKGEVGLHEVAASESRRPKLMILNDTGGVLASGQFSDPSTGAAGFRFTSVGPGRWSQFSDVSPGVWTGSWSLSAGRPPFLIPAEDLAAGRWYVLILTRAPGRESFASLLRDVSALPR